MVERIFSTQQPWAFFLLRSQLAGKRRNGSKSGDEHRNTRSDFWFAPRPAPERHRR
jgi:hypothetical protein